MNRKDIKKLDSLWSTVVKEKAKWKCEHCGKYDSRMEAAHVVGRRHRATRWGFKMLNANIPLGTVTEKWDLCGHCLCHCCHQQYDEHGPLEDEIIDRTIRRDRKEFLQREATKKVTSWQVYEDYVEILERERAANDDSPYSQS